MAAMETESGVEKSTQSDCRFEWDEESKLYFHSSSGFYHDPNTGWYYSSRDGLYYTFENGSYVLLTCSKDEKSKTDQCTSSTYSEPIQEDQDKPIDIEEEITCDVTENQCPPSVWLEETLINLYLSGYSKSEVNPDSSSATLQTSGEERSPDSYHLASDKSLDCYHGNHGTRFHECEWISDVAQDVQEPSELTSEEEDASCNEEKWQAQYGQVVHLEDVDLPSLPLIDLWDWEMVVEDVRKRRQVARLVGRLNRRSNKMLHPSVPAGGNILRTSTIRDVHLDLVRVASGKVYRLRSPNARYLASICTYDASNPTKDWGFPELYINKNSISPIDLNQSSGSNISNEVNGENSLATVDRSTMDKKSKPAYRDRASERRILHGAFSIGPGQKNSENDFLEGSSSQSFDTEIAAAEALNMSFGSGSYGRRIIESMGWKEGEALGSTNKGILEPLLAIGNKGQSGLGWNHGSRGA